MDKGIDSATGQEKKRKEEKKVGDVLKDQDTRV